MLTISRSPIDSSITHLSSAEPRDNTAPRRAGERMRIFVALFDYDPPTMSPNPDACDEELPFREGQLIKVSHASRVSRVSCVSRVSRVMCAGVRREGRGRVLLGRGGAEAGLRPLQHGVRGPGGWRQCDEQRDNVTTCCSWLARCEGAGCDTRQAPGVAPPLNNPRTNHSQR